MKHPPERPMSIGQAKPIRHKRPRWQRPLVLAISIIGFPILFLRVTYAGINWWGDSQLEVAFAEADRLDPGWRLKDLDAKRLSPASDKNGNHQVRRIKAAMPAGEWPAWPFPQFDDDSEYLCTVRSAIERELYGDRKAPCLLNAEELRVLRAEIARAAPAIELARKMPDYPYGRSIERWANDYRTTPLTGLQETRVVADLLKYDARLRANNNDLEGALHDVKALLFVSRAIGDDPRIEALLYRVPCDSLASTALEQCLACGRVSEETLVDFQREFEREAEVPFYLLAVRGERAGCDFQLDNVQQGAISPDWFYRMDADLDSSYLSSTWSPDDDPPSALQKNFEFVRKYVYIRDARAKMLRFMNEQVEFGKLPTWEKIKATEAKANSLAFGHSSQRGLSRAFYHMTMMEADLLATLRTAYTALAIERFHLAHGKWPERLQDLVPQYLSTLPLDPYDGAPLRIVQKGSAIVVYSIARNEEDQGETIFDAPSSPGSNLAFVLHDPSQRRRPAKPFVFPPRPAMEQPDLDDPNR